LARIEPASQRLAESARVGTQPAGIAIGSGSVWVTNSGEARVTRYNPAAFQEPLDDFRVGRRPTGVAAGEAIWVANSADRSVSRIDPNAGDVVRIVVGEGPSGIAITPDAVWVVNRGDGTLSRIDPEKNEVERTIAVGNAPSGIALADGLIWVTVQAP
jgi:peptide/nickel transport system substrate-binding protein